MVSCPICSKHIPLAEINEHLDLCEIKNKNRKVEAENDIPSDGVAKEHSDKPENVSKVETVHGSSQPMIAVNGDSHTTSLASILTGKKKSKDKPTYQYRPSHHHETSPLSSVSSSNEINTPAVNSKRPISGDECRDDLKRHKKQIIDNLKISANLPLSERLRPTDIGGYIGQQHLVGPRGVLRGYLKQGRVPSLIFWGKPGTGKTTLARILAKTTNMRFVEMSGVINGVSDCKKVFEEAVNEMKLTRKSTIMFIDEIHRFSKSQQDIFLQYVERGIIILIGATTENPSFTVNKAILSRCKVFTLEKLSNHEMREMVGRGLVEINKVRKLVHNTSVLKLSEEGIDWIISVADGDGRQALGFVEMIDINFTNTTDENKPEEVTLEDIKGILKNSPMLYDRVGDAHYDTISAFHKSVRGSNPDAAMYYLARMLQGGEDPLYIARRMIRIASEDIGVLDDSCLPFAVAAYQAVQMVGLPEADLALVHCAVKLSRAPKSVEIYRGWNQMKAWTANPEISGAEIPLHLRNAPTKLMSDLGYKKGYKYPPDFKDGKVSTTYFPDSVGEQQFLKGQHLGDAIDPDL